MLIKPWWKKQNKLTFTFRLGIPTLRLGYHFKVGNISIPNLKVVNINLKVGNAAIPNFKVEITNLKVGNIVIPNLKVDIPNLKVGMKDGTPNLKGKTPNFRLKFSTVTWASQPEGIITTNLKSQHYCWDSQPKSCDSQFCFHFDF